MLFRSGASASPASYAGQISIGSSGTFSYGSTSNQTLTGKIAGAGAVTKSGTSTLTLSPGTASDYTGATTVSAGTLKITAASSLGGTGTGTTVSSGATLDVAGAVTSAEPLTISGTGVSSAGAVNFTASGTLSGTVALGAASTIQVSDSVEATISGVISGAQNLTKGGTGTGTLTLSAANTYTGTTSISVGTVKITDAKALGETADGLTRSTTTVSSGATLQIASAITSAEPLTISGSGSGNDSGSGTGSIRVISDNDYALFYGDSSNVTSLKYQNNLEWPAQISGASSLDISDAGSYIYIVQMGGGGTEDIGGTINNVDITTMSGVQRATAGSACGGLKIGRAHV